ncbi:MAG: YggS family pyridoxal phosphate-dependent enzyme [Thiobacillaceae bacterium]
MMNSVLCRNLRRVNDEIAEAVIRGGRPIDSVKLIAVSKTRPAEVLAEAAQAGQWVFGENRVQEALDKQVALRSLSANMHPLEWHLIGHLQSNKAKFVPAAFQWVHTIDSLELAKRISDAALKVRLVCNALIQVNVADDPAKQGIESSELTPLIEAIHGAQLGGLALRGLMTIGRLNATESEARQAFSGLRMLRDQVRESLGMAEFNELSMGMSGDFPLAIEEGATMIRVGSAIFGEREYPRAG